MLQIKSCARSQLDPLTRVDSTLLYTHVQTATRHRDPELTEQYQSLNSIEL